jgi:hypothetical protein
MCPCTMCLVVSVGVDVGDLLPIRILSFLDVLRSECSSESLPGPSLSPSGCQCSTIALDLRL